MSGVLLLSTLVIGTPDVAAEGEQETGTESQTQAPAGPVAKPTSGSDRLFLGFAEEATVVDRQWWEGQFEANGGDNIDQALIRLVVAVQPIRDLEIGGRVGFGSTDTTQGLPEGNGATDLDIWARYWLGVAGEATEFAAGGTLVVPTGDDSVGLGFDSFAIGGFGSLRHRLKSVILSGYLGARFNGNGQILGVDLQGKTSAYLGFGALLPISDRVTITAELRAESKRFRELDSDFRLMGGINWRVTNRGQFRGAVGVGSADGVAAPDVQLLAGYVAVF